MAECFLAGEKGWMFSALSGEVAILICSLVPNNGNIPPSSNIAVS